MSRLPRLPPAELDQAQAELYGSIVGGPRVAAAGSRSLTDDEGRLGGPFNAWLRNPKLGASWSAVGEALRFATGLDRRVFEVAVATVAAHYRCDYEWAAHRTLAAKAGVDAEVLDALGQGAAPPFARDDEASAYRVTRALLTRGRLDEREFAGMTAAFGEVGAFELVSTVGYYASLALALNAFEVAPPPGFDTPWAAEGR